MNKKELGQFFTTNYKYIMDGMKQPDIKHIIEPFTGNKDLIEFLDNKDEYKIEYYDIDPKSDDIKQQDTILNPPDYTNKYVITNPPYLARNKSKNKTIFDKYKQNDLYKCFLMTLFETPPVGGILIIPLNFWSSIRKSDYDLRERFIRAFYVERVNIFEETVFDDTSYTICCFQFVKSTAPYK